MIFVRWHYNKPYRRVTPWHVPNNEGFRTLCGELIDPSTRGFSAKIDTVIGKECALCKGKT